MKDLCRASLILVCLAAPILLCLAGGRAVLPSALAAGATARATIAHQFYTRVLGDWVGTTVSRLDGAEPVTGYFHLRITRVDENAFREEYTFYRVHPKTGVLERSGTQTDLSTIASDGVIRRTCRGSGTVLIDLRSKNQSFDLKGEACLIGPDRLEVKAQGKIAVDGMPLNLGKKGKLKAKATWSLEEEKLIGQTHAESSFRVVLFRKRYRIESQLRGRRGADIRNVAG